MSESASKSSPNTVTTAPCKLFIKDLKASKKQVDGGWSLKVPTNFAGDTTIEFGLVWLQGLIDQTAGPNKEILIIKDESGKAKITDCTTVPGDRTWFTQDAYCSVIGCLIQETGLPIVKAIKITNLNNSPIYREMWPIEVNELKIILTEKLVLCTL